MKQCIHPNCKKLIKANFQLCYFHNEELVNNGEGGHWDCTWCKEYKQFDTEDEARGLAQFETAFDEGRTL